MFIRYRMEAKKMARRGGFVRLLVQTEQAVGRQQATTLREQNQMRIQVERAQRNYDRAVIADEKERQKFYIESRDAEITLQNEQLDQQIHLLEHLLLDALDTDPFINIQGLKQPSHFPAFNPGGLAQKGVRPELAMYMPPELTTMKRLLPWVREKYDISVLAAQQTFQTNLKAYNIYEDGRQHTLTRMKADYDRRINAEQQKVFEQHAIMDTFQHDMQAGIPQSVIEYFSMVLESSLYPEEFPCEMKLAYVPESKQLVVEYDLPTFDVVPEVGSYKYTKVKDIVTETVRPLAQRKALYASIIAQVTLRTVYELFKSDRLKCLDVIVFNGCVSSINKGTGQSIHPCIVTLRTSRDAFTRNNLHKVEPQACLNVLNALFSTSPTELLPVRPVLAFSMVDPRFIEEMDILSGLDQRQNLMDLTPSEFESLITNLFQKMGLETRLTRASRDGGVDCVAYDQRPIVGGKVVIQAKRYKNTVGVSAVRDLFGTTMKEGASKGILVTTSGYGKASFDFAANTPLELLSGSNLLYLLKEHTGFDYRIEMPDSWKDPQQDVSSDQNE